MPYQSGNRLGGERASKLGHLDVINSELVNNIVGQFEDPKPSDVESPISWEPFDPSTEEPLRLIFSVDGSKQTIRSDFPPYKEVAFVKTAFLRLDQHAINKLDPDDPHPQDLKDIMTDSALYHATLFPLKGIKIAGKNNFDAVRQIIFESLQDKSLGAEPFKTLKWIAYEKWHDQKINSPKFECPACKEDVDGLPYDSDEGKCAACGCHLYLSDMIGFHLEMGEEVAPDSMAMAYMLVHEHLWLFTGIRNFWEQKKFNVLNQTLFIKDGPLFLRGQYSKLVIPIRRFFEFAKTNKVFIHVMGQEKTGSFANHSEIISKNAPPTYSIFLPTNDYIRKEIQHRSEHSEDYGSRTNYGNKLFVKPDPYHHFVLTIPTGEYKDNKTLDDLIGVKRILATIPNILSYKYENALVPIELANGVASLSNYPSASVLKMFAGL